MTLIQSKRHRKMSTCASSPSRLFTHFPSIFGFVSLLEIFQQDDDLPVISSVWFRIVVIASRSHQYKSAEIINLAHS